jgi:DNA-binding CsgD family transcriptional regulator
MIELEKLYGCAEQHLQAENQNWDRFAADFKSAFRAKLMLYMPTFEADELAWRSSKGLVATTDPHLAAEYIDKKMFERNHVPEHTLNPLEPQRRTDDISDDQYRSLEIVQDFFLPRGVFYLMAVSAILKDQSYLILVVFRDENERDFSDIEKQRLALFMRYLATFLRKTDPIATHASEAELASFGEKYSLTNTEMSVLAALLQGHSLRQIADESDRSYGTVRWHVQNILEKCHVQSQKSLLSEFYSLIKS